MRCMNRGVKWASWTWTDGLSKGWSGTLLFRPGAQAHQSLPKHEYAKMGLSPSPQSPSKHEYAKLGLELTEAHQSPSGPENADWAWSPSPSKPIQARVC
ncbi:hypothetical protein U1Q18_023670 [Sarracenia purpurea var. burkii]